MATFRTSCTAALHTPASSGVSATLSMTLNLSSPPSVDRNSNTALSTFRLKACMLLHHRVPALPSSPRVTGGPYRCYRIREAHMAPQYTACTGRMHTHNYHVKTPPFRCQTKCRCCYYLTHSPSRRNPLEREREKELTYANYKKT